MQFDRVVEIVVGKAGGKAVSITDLRVAFSIHKGATPHPNKCTAKIYNLAPESRALVEQVNNVVILRAGYAQEQGPITIFTGTVARALTVWDGPDWITELEMHDALLEFRDSKMSASFPAGTSGLKVVQFIAAQFNLPVRHFPTDTADKIYPGGFAFAGRVRDGMVRACKYLGLEWSIQNREVQVLTVGGTLGRQALVVSPTTGMIGHPAREEKTMCDKTAARRGYTAGSPGTESITTTSASGKTQQRLEVLGYQVKCQLQPILQPGSYVKVKSLGIDQFFRVERLEHAGDTRGTNWETRLVLRYV
jgi:hypothetical protein